MILPGIFPYLVTGLVTASGGAWNASIVAEYFRLKDRMLSDQSAWARRSARPRTPGNFDMLLLATMVMATMVVTVRSSGVAAAVPACGDEGTNWKASSAQRGIRPLFAGDGLVTPTHHSFAASHAETSLTPHGCGW